MKKIVLHFSDGYKMDVIENLEQINLVENFNSFYDDLIVESINNIEYRFSGFENEYQIFNIQTRELYNIIDQNGVVKVSIQLDENEFNQILKIIKRKENDFNN
jgi:hypothetical protein